MIVDPLNVQDILLVGFEINSQLRLNCVPSILRYSAFNGFVLSGESRKGSNNKFSQTSSRGKKEDSIKIASIVFD